MKGINFHKNPNNGFAVLRIHYTADPAKDPDTPEGKKWLAEAQRGYDDEAWRREYEIDFSAGAGKPVYPMFSMNQVKEIKWNGKGVIYRGWDFGFYHPACVWTTVDDKDRWCWLLEELGDQETIDHFANRILDITEAKFPNAMIRDFGDPSGVQVRDIASERGEQSSVQVLANKGILLESRKDLSVKDGLDVIRMKMKLRADGEYGLLVDQKGCSDCIEAFLGGYRAKDKPEQEERPVKDGYFEHIMDAGRYIAVNIFDTATQTALGDVVSKQPQYIRHPVTGGIVG